MSTEFERRIVKLNAGARCYLLISPPVVNQQSAAVLRKRRQVRIEFVDVLVDSVRLG
jgi:hypothetical protein